jgi:hypothetical protein
MRIGGETPPLLATGNSDERFHQTAPDRSGNLHSLLHCEAMCPIGAITHDDINVETY